ncbi:MAG: hypothetical protein ACI9FN_000356 [Saprospiraceae bacterium]|jgi:hypothetical protein
MKYFLRIILVLFCVVAIALIWFFYLRSTERPYVDTAVISTMVHTGQTADFNENRNAYFGDLHIHTSWSFDAFVMNVRTSPDDAYSFGKGAAIPHAGGEPIQIGRPLDFMAVTDHAEYMGVFMQMQDAENPLSKLEIAKEISNTEDDDPLKKFRKIGLSLATMNPYEELLEKDIVQNTWQRIVAAADRHYEPGKFTTFPAYEWTSSPIKLLTKERYSEKLHRNIVFEGGKVSGVPFSAFNSQDPEDLWAWMDKERGKGIDVLAIPHNANMSSGQMYNTETLSGKPLTVAYAQSRSRNEPINEVVQIKGQSMTHPILSPNDEFADYELYAYSSSLSVTAPKSQPKHSYVREALGNGLAFEKSLGTNPYKFGFIGSSDSHNAASAAEEDNYFGKIGLADPTPSLRLNPPEERLTKYMSAAGLAGVWAEENTREAIFEAMQRKETFATSGPRIKLRFFAGWDMEVDSLTGNAWVTEAYLNGVPMGSDLNRPSSSVHRSPSFLIQAIKDVDGANLDRVQMIKAFLDKDGKPQETIFEVSWAGDRSVDAKGKLPAIGTTVDVATATYTNDIGAISFQTEWVDPTFDANQSAVYYVRVLEIPTPRWSTYDAAALGITPLSDLPTTVQERAWSSPIWYKQK